MKLEKEEYEGKMFLKPYHNKNNPDGAHDGDIVTIRKVEKQKLKQTGETWLMTFKEYPNNALALNKTNLQKCVELFGDETDDWVRETVKLFVTEAPNPQNKGILTPTIRIKAKDWNYGDDEGEYSDETEETPKKPREPTKEEIEEEKIEEARATARTPKRVGGHKG